MCHEIQINKLSHDFSLDNFIFHHFFFGISDQYNEKNPTTHTQHITHRKINAKQSWKIQKQREQQQTTTTKLFEIFIRAKRIGICCGAIAFIVHCTHFAKNINPNFMIFQLEHRAQKLSKMENIVELYNKNVDAVKRAQFIIAFCWCLRAKLCLERFFFWLSRNQKDCWEEGGCLCWERWEEGSRTRAERKAEVKKWTYINEEKSRRMS